MKRKSFSFACCLFLVLFGEPQTTAQDALRAHAEVLNASAPFTYPSGVLVGPDRNLYFLDPVLSSIFVHDLKAGKIRRLCGPDSLGTPVSDIAIGTKGRIWVLSQRDSKVRRLNSQCVVEREFKVSLIAQQIATNSFGELIVLNTIGRLFYLFSANGKRGNVLHRWDGVQHNKQPLFANENTN
jgi:streptogramin lyase